MLTLTGGSLLVVACGTAWLVFQTGDTSAEEVKRDPDLNELGDGSKSIRNANQDSAKSSLASLPVHLQAIILDLVERIELMEEDGEITTAELVEAGQIIEPRIQALGFEDFKLLMAFYDYPPSDLVVAEGYGPIGDMMMYKRWGQLDPDGLYASMIEEIDRTLAALTKPIRVADAYVGDVDMKVGFEDYEDIFEGWATRDPLAALRAWEAIHTTLAAHPMIEDAGQLNAEILDNISSGWSESAPLDAWRHLKKNLSDLPYEWRDGFVWGLRQGAPWLEMAQEFSNSPDETLAILGPRIVGRWACYEPEAAIAWMLASSPQALDAMFNSWYNRGVEGQAFLWLQRNHANVQEVARISSLRSAVRLEWKRIDDVITILRTLPRTETTWKFLSEMAQITDTSPSGYDVSKTLNAAQLRSLVETLHPPDGVRKGIEAGLAAKAKR